MRTTIQDSEVLVVLDGKPVKGTISEVITQGAARIQLDGDKGSVQASYSDGGEEGTFHYADQAKDVKKSDTFGKTPGAAEPAAEPADDKKSTSKK